MKIAKEQYDALVAKLDALQETNRLAGKDVEEIKEVRDREMARGRLWCERIEHAQSVLCERLDALAKHIEEREKAGDEALKKILAIRQQEYEDLSGQNANLLTQIMLLKLEVRAKKPAKRAKK